VIAGRTGIFHV